MPFSKAQYAPVPPQLALALSAPTIIAPGGLLVLSGNAVLLRLPPGPAPRIICAGRRTGAGYPARGHNRQKQEEP